MVGLLTLCGVDGELETCLSAEIAFQFLGMGIALLLFLSELSFGGYREEVRPKMQGFEELMHPSET